MYETNPPEAPMKYLSVLLSFAFFFSACSGGTSSPCGDCSDGVACTVDTCNEETEQCEHQADDSRCGQGEICDSQDGCVPDVECTGDANCDDRQYCNGAERCVDNKCQAGTAVNCADIVNCTDDTCDEDMNVCINTPNNANCEAGYRCDIMRDCIPNVCATDIDCDDTNICTTDTCVDNACEYENNPVSCNDYLWCTENDECVDGKCQGTLRD
jgi:hypothetical protein